MSVAEIIETIVTKIRTHREGEIDKDVRNSAIACVNGILDDKEQTFWIVPGSNRVDDVLPNINNNNYVTRDSIAGGILIQNQDGIHSYTVRGKFKDELTKHTIQILNKSTYIPSANKKVLAVDINITTNVPGDRKAHRYNNLVELLARLNITNKQITETREKLTTAEKEPQNTDIKHLRTRLEKEKEEQRVLLDSAQRLIRHNAELRWQPILDREQDAIKRMKIFDGGTLIINGGPGTGKTTSLVQRIKFLTSDTIKEYYAFNRNQEKVLFYQKPCWIFFSPSKLLALFLKNNMAREDLAASENTVKVWDKYRETIIRLYGWLDQEKRVFSVRKQDNGSLFAGTSGTREIIMKFDKYCINRQKNELRKICEKLESQKNEIQDRIKELDRQIEALNKEIAVIKQENQKLGKPDKTWPQERCDKRSELNDRENKMDRKCSGVREQKNVLEQENRTLQNIIRGIADYLSGNNTGIKKLIQIYIGIEQMKSGKNDGRVFDAAINNIFRIIPGAYKAFRVEEFDAFDSDWNHELLVNLIDKPNQDIHPDEQSLLIYTINSICYDGYQDYGSYFQDSKSNYIRTYMQCCKPVIAIDEATDFSLIDILAMRSFRHPALSSVTLSGDVMQRMSPFGLKSWEEFSSYCAPPARIENLTISYRQSPTLLVLARKIYQHSTRTQPEYKSFMDYESSEPKPLLKISEDNHEKITWIAARIREIDAVYRQSIGQLPSVAVFVPDEEDINDFVSELEMALNGDIPVAGCPNGLILGESSDVRVYAINKIKGLEFEAVFFHNLDSLPTQDEDILLKHLYVGLSRATFYLGVTLSRQWDSGLEFIQNEFVQDGDWHQFRNENSEMEIKGT